MDGGKAHVHPSPFLPSLACWTSPHTTWRSIGQSDKLVQLLHMQRPLSRGQQFRACLAGDVEQKLPQSSCCMTPVSHDH